MASVNLREAPRTERFAFGKNWKHFSGLVTDERIQSSVASLRNALRLLPDEDLVERHFLDVGCGSGLSSLAALRLGARVTAFDLDQESVATTRTLIENSSHLSDHYSVEQGSALDPDFLASLGTFDIVYAWGVLHHTGEMWKAVAAVAETVGPSGLLLLALYNDQGGASRRWATIKRAYVRGGPIRQFCLVSAVGFCFELRAAIVRSLRLQNPLAFKEWNKRRHERGMSVWHDLKDWVGGYPFEVAKPEQVLDALRPRGFTLEAMKTCGAGHGCNEFLFRKSA